MNGIAPFLWGSSGAAVPWEQRRSQQQSAQMMPIDSPLQGLGMMAQAFTDNMRTDARNYFPGADGGYSFNPFARFFSQGGLY